HSVSLLGPSWPGLSCTASVTPDLRLSIGWGGRNALSRVRACVVFRKGESAPLSALLRRPAVRVGTSAARTVNTSGAALPFIHRRRGSRARRAIGRRRRLLPNFGRF